MSFDEVLESLDMEIDKRLYELKQKELVNLLAELIKGKDKKTLAKLASDGEYFHVNDLIKGLEKKVKPLLFKVLNEPKKEENLRQPVANWLKDQWGYPNYDFEVDMPNSRRKIDVVGCEYSVSRLGGLLGSGEDRIVAIEIKTTPSRSAIDSAFSQAKDYTDCSDWSYVAVSPYVFLKYFNVLFNKIKRYKNEIGLLLVDRLRVISEVSKAKHTEYDDGKYGMVLDYFRKQ